MKRLSSTFSTVAERAAEQANAGSTPENLTSGRLLAGNTVWNFIGTCLPALIAVFCLPVLKRDF